MRVLGIISSEFREIIGTFNFSYITTAFEENGMMVDDSIRVLGLTFKIAYLFFN